MKLCNAMNLRIQGVLFLIKIFSNSPIIPYSPTATIHSTTIDIITQSSLNRWVHISPRNGYRVKENEAVVYLNVIWYNDGVYVRFRKRCNWYWKWERTLLSLIKNIECKLVEKIFGLIYYFFTEDSSVWSLLNWRLVNMPLIEE